MKARFRAIFSVAAFGTIGVFVRSIPPASGELTLYRAVVAVMALLLWQAYTGQFIKVLDIKKELLLLFLSRAVISVNWILFFEAYRYTIVAMATLSYYFTPVIITVSSTLLFRERLTSRQVFCFIMSIFGLVLVIGVSNGSGSNNLLDILLGLEAALFYATVVLLSKRIHNISGLNRTFLQFITAILVIMPYVFLTGGSYLGSLDLAGAVNLLVVRIFHIGVYHYIYSSSLRYLRGQEASILSYVDPLVAVAILVPLLHECVLPLQAAGGYMILGSTMLNEWGPGTGEHRG